MRIFQALSARAVWGVSQSTIWLRNLYEPLVELGHEVFLWQFDGTRLHDWSEPLVDAFRREHARKPFDLFFSYFRDGMVEPGAILEIGKAGVPTCNFSCNNTHQFHLVEKLSPVFDYNLYAEKDAKLKFEKLGPRGVWFPMAANPQYYRPLGIPRILDVSFVGQCYARRPYYIGHLLKNGVDVQVYGPGWLLKPDKPLLRRPVRWARRARLLLKSLVARSLEKRHEFSARVADMDLRNHLRWKYATHLHRPISDDDMIRKYSESKICLGFLEVYDRHNPAAVVKQHLHLREFEAPMSGALYFTGYCDELTEFYEPDKEVIVYRNEHELLDKVRYYLAFPDQADLVRQAGHRRALADHTYQRRFETLFRQLNLAD